MKLYNTTTELIDFSTSTNNRKRVISSIEMGLGIFLLILGLGTATCETEEKQNEQIK